MVRAGKTAIASLGLSMLLSAAEAQTPPAAPPPCTVQDPATVTMAETLSPYILHGDTMAVRSCTVSGTVILCTFALQRNQAGSAEYYYDAKAPEWSSKLVDNFKVEHAQLRGYLENGHCAHVAEINLDNGDWVWFFQEFEGPVDGVTSARIIFNPSRSQPPFFWELHSPVVGQ
jgi:hypothetical protein